MIHFIANVLKNLQPYIPLFQSLVWPIFIALALLLFRRQASTIIEAIRKRIEKGSSIKAGPLEIGEDLKQLEYAQPTQRQPVVAEDKTTQDWNQERNDIYKKNHGLFLAHVITPSRAP